MRTKDWEKIITEKLAGATIVSCQYMTIAEAEEFGWYHRPISITLRHPDGHAIQLIPSSDDEGNSGGSIFTSIEELPTIPVM